MVEVSSGKSERTSFLPLPEVLVRAVLVLKLRWRRRAKFHSLRKSPWCHRDAAAERPRRSRVARGVDGTGVAPFLPDTW